MKDPAAQLDDPQKRLIHRHGFTLLELSVCLVVLGLLGGTAALSLRGVRRNVDLETWSERFVQLDQRVRQRAERQGRPWRLVVDLHDQAIWAEPIAPAPAPGKSGHRGIDSPPGSTLAPPTGWTLAAVRTTEEPIVGTTRQAVVPCSTHGVSPTYAVQLRNSQDHSRWLLVAGGSGQWTPTDDDTTIDNLFATLRHAAGDDAH